MLYSRRRSNSAQNRRGPAKSNSQQLFWHDDGHLLLRGAAAAILSHDYDRMLTRFQRLSEVTEAAVTADAGHRLAIDNQRRARFRLAKNFHYAPVQLGAADFQHHLLGATLCDDGEFKGFADFAGLLVDVGRDDIPEIISRIQATDFNGGSGQPDLLDHLGEHGGGANAQGVGDGVLHRFPFEM